MILRFRIPMAGVSVNSMYERHVGGVHKAESARLFAEAAAHFGLAARKRARWETFDGLVEVLFVVDVENPAADVDNVVKLAQDALQKSNPRKRMLGAGIIADDNQVVSVHVEKRMGKRAGIEVLVAPLGELFPRAMVDDLLERTAAV